MKKKKVTINMKKYIKPKIEIIHAAPAQLMGISTMKLSTNTSVFYDADKEKNSDFNIIGGDDDSGDGDLDAAKRWNDWGEDMWSD